MTQPDIETKLGSMSDSASPAPWIVVGIDGSEASKEALRWAARQAGLTGASLRALTSWHLPVYYGAGVAVPGDIDFEGDARRMQHDTISEVLGPEAAAKVEATVVQGPPALELLKAAHDAELLVLGNRGHGAFTGMLLGSVSEHCISHASCPVLVIRHPADEGK